MTSRIYVGVCRFSYKLSEIFSLLEIQETFYNLVSSSRAERWASKTREGTILTLKVFQGITHEGRSPTWKRYKGKDFDEIKTQVGSLKINDTTIKFWNHMIDIAKILSSPILLLQTPASFRPTEENIENMRKTLEFLNDKTRKLDIKIGWEPRGKWLEENGVKIIRSIGENHPWLIHVVDPLFHEPAFVGETTYFRLHGKPYLNYRYRYGKEDFEALLKIISNVIDQGTKEIYILFNNVYMVDDAKSFKEFALKEGLKIL